MSRGQVNVLGGLIWILALAGFFWFSQPANGAGRDPIPYRIDAWNEEAGLPQSSVTAIVQTRDRYLWLGTFGGVARFDGSTFKVFDTKNTPQMPNSRVLSLFEDRAGGLWIGTEDGLVSRSLEGRLEILRPPNHGLISKFIKAYAEAPDGSMWMARADGSLLRLEKGQFTAITGHWTLQGTKVQGMTTDRQGRIWIGTEKELAVWQDGRFNIAWNQAREPGFSVDGLTRSEAGGVWVAGHSRIRRFSEGRWISDYGAYRWSKGVVSQLCEDRHGQLWVGLYGSGLLRYDTNGVVLRLSGSATLPGNFIRSLLEDAEGNMWAGTESQGVVRIKPVAFRSYGREQGLASDDVLTVCEGREGELWIGTNGEGIDRFKDGVVTHFRAGEGLTNECIWSLCQGRDKTVWAGTWGGGLFQRKEETFSVLNHKQCGPVVCALFEDSKSRLWIGQTRTGSEMLSLDAGKASTVHLPTTRPDLDIRAITEDNRRNIWIGTRGDGLYCLSQGKQARFGQKEGLSGESILALYGDPEGALWISTREGLNRLQNGRFRALGAREGLPETSILSIVEDNRRNLWCGCSSGIFRVNKDALNQALNGSQPSVRCFSYSRADGLPSLECSGGCQPAGCKTRDGRLWFATVNGLAVVDPDNVPFNPLPPPVTIDEVVIEGERTSQDFKTLSHEISPSIGTIGGSSNTVLRVPAGKHRLEFRYNAISFTAPEKVRFRYKLEGLEHEWVPARDERAAHYSYLGPGTYRFRVSASNSDGVWNETGASLAVIVPPLFWQTAWFRSIAGGVILLGIIGALELRVAMERRVTRLRLRIARDLHDEVGSNLGTIALLSEVISRQFPSIGQELVEVRRVAGQSIESLRDIVWFLNPACDNMAELALRMKDTAKVMLPSTAVQFVSSGETKAPKPSLELRRNLFSMFKEILHNISRHAQATRVNIALEVDSNQLTLRIQDNGVGFDEEMVRGGNGLKNLRRRAADLAGSVQIESTKGSGTVVKVIAPLV